MCAANARKSIPDEQIVRPDAATVAAKKHEIAVRYRKGKRPFSMASKRVKELRGLFESRHGNQLPDDDAGRDDAKVMLDHMAARPGAMPAHLETFLRQWCPWMDADEIAEMTADAMAKPLRYRADTLATRLRLTEAERTALNIMTIGAIDLPKAEREARRKVQSSRRSRDWRARKRVANDAPTRAEYEANSISQTKAWLLAGFRCRRTWERHGKPVASPERTILPFNKRDATCDTPPISDQAAPPRLQARKGCSADHRDPHQPFALERKAA
jgi:hypothetical protein